MVYEIYRCDFVCIFYMISVTLLHLTGCNSQKVLFIILCRVLYMFLCMFQHYGVGFDR